MINIELRDIESSKDNKGFLKKMEIPLDFTMGSGSQLHK